MDSDMQKIIDTLKQVCLSQNERVNMRAKLSQTIQNIPATRESKPHFSQSSTLSPFFSFMHIHRRAFSMLGVFLLMTISVGDIVEAANRALPGDVLYPVKIAVNENVGRILHSNSPVALVNFETNVMETRLVEAETLSKNQTLNPVSEQTVKTEITKQANRLQEAVVKLEDEKNTVDATAQNAAYATTTASVGSGRNAHIEINTQATTSLRESTTTSVKQKLNIHATSTVQTESIEPKNPQAVDASQNGTQESDQTTPLSSLATTTPLSTPNQSFSVTNQTTIDTETKNALQQINQVLQDHHVILQKIEADTTSGSKE